MTTEIIWSACEFSETSLELTSLVAEPSRIIFVTPEYHEKKTQHLKKNRHLFLNGSLAFRCRGKLNN